MKLSKGIILLLLGLFFKVAVADSSTQVYWLELEIESSVYDNITELLRLHPQISITDATVTNIVITTDCKLDEIHKNCSCMLDHTFSEDILKKYDCRNDTCMQKVNDIAVCLPKKRVSINGLTTFANESCIVLCDPNKRDTKEYQDDNNKIIKMLAEKYSTLKNFDSLIINSYRSGSVIANYTVQVMGPVTLNELENITNNLPNSDLKTTGFIIIGGTLGPIDIDSSVTITCRPQDTLGEVKWYLIDEWNKKKTEITKGQEASFDNKNSEDIVYLKNISGSWKDHYQHHWFPNAPCRGSGYRCIRINHKMDPLIGKAACTIGLTKEQLFSLLPSELTMWIDPYEVSYRIGEDGSICVLYESTPPDTNQPESCKDELRIRRPSPSKSFSMMTCSS